MNNIDDIKLIEECIQNKDLQSLAISFYLEFGKKYPFLELQKKWNSPFFCFQDQPVFYFAEKTQIDKVIFKEPLLFLGIMEGFKLFKNQLFVSSSHTQVRYINLSTLKKTQFENLLSLIGEALEI
ncbi:MAG: hypothetical protein ACRCXZ_00355 [Patescibacteria group bacterium]